MLGTVAAAVIAGVFAIGTGWDGRVFLIIVLSGTFGNWHGIPTLAAALSRVCAARPDVRWLLIGDGPLRGIQPIQE